MYSKIIDYLYHGSPNFYRILKPFKSTHGIPAVYATPDVDFALCYAGNQWHDGLMNQSYYNGQLTLTELIPDIFNSLYDRPGYIYIIDDLDGFEWVLDFDGRRSRKELYSFRPVKYCDVIKISNVLGEIINNSNIDLYYYPDKPIWWKKVTMHSAKE